VLDISVGKKQSGKEESLRHPEPTSPKKKKMRLWEEAWWLCGPQSDSGRENGTEKEVVGLDTFTWNLEAYGKRRRPEKQRGLENKEVKKRSSTLYSLGEGEIEGLERRVCSGREGVTDGRNQKSVGHRRKKQDEGSRGGNEGTYEGEGPVS